MLNIVELLIYWLCTVFMVLSYALTFWISGAFEGDFMKPKLPWVIHAYGIVGFGLLTLGILG